MMTDNIISSDMWKNLLYLAGLSVTAGLCAGLAHLWYNSALSQVLGPLGTGIVFGMSSGWLLFFGWLALLYQRKSKARQVNEIKAVQGNASLLGGPTVQTTMQDASPYQQEDYMKT